MALGTLEALAARCREGDAAALSSLCQKLETPVFRLCVRMLGDVRDAEDAAQDVLVKIITNLADFRGESALLTWVHRIAVRHLWAIKKGRAEQQALTEEAFSSLLEQGLSFGATQAGQTADEKTFASEVRLSCTQGMLLTLSREDRLALVLVELLGFDLKEAAEVMESTHEALRQRVSRARLRLGAFLQKKCGVVNSGAACSCERQVPAKRALGLASHTLRFSPLAVGRLQPSTEVSVAMDELRAVRSISQAFSENGAWKAPDTLRARLASLLPTVLG
jgi:RNA polymerase sigma factor (sigma-70 family)